MDAKRVAWGARLAVGVAVSCFGAEVTVYPHVQHEVHGIREFDRSKFITIHSSFGEKEWLEEVRGERNFTDDLLADFFEGYDVYFGRDTGTITGVLKRLVDEDPERPGWPLREGGKFSIVEQGRAVREAYALKAAWHPYEHRAGSDVVCTQFHPFWPDGTETSRGWALSRADTAEEPFGSATGYYIGHFLNEAYANEAVGQKGRPRPRLLEVINEPDWELWKLNAPESAEVSDPVWRFHRSVAEQVHELSPQVKVGGFCNAFPDHQNQDFKEWELEWKSFIDYCGDEVDFYTLHLYGFDDPYANWERKGSNLEATLDLIEHYSAIRLGRPLPFLVSEYGDRARKLENGPWSSHRDWKFMKAMNSMLLSFVDRPHLMEKAIPFVLCKGEWGRKEFPDSWRLMRQANEPESCTGEWVYSDLIQFYDLWKDVRGTRVRVTASDVDIQSDAYVDGNKLCLILNNLNREPEEVDLAVRGSGKNPIVRVREKNFYLSKDKKSTLEKRSHDGGLESVRIGAQGAVVLQYEFASEVVAEELVEEVKLYATECMKPIEAGVPLVFSVEGIPREESGTAVLRLGMGRKKELGRQPLIRFNGQVLEVPTDFMGNDTGDDRAEFFGVLDVPVPYELLERESEISVTYPDSGGHVASVALRVFGRRAWGSD